jgi:Rrf2 family iron-sulfur cluster assembly transcriptional regulator
MLIRGRPAVAVAVVVDVALHAARGTVSAADIAERLGLARRGLEPILQPLSRNDILSSTRGPKGGYRLARPRRAITAAAIVRAVQAEAPAEAPGEGETGKLFTAVIGPLWATLDAQVMAALEQQTLDLLVRRAVAAGVAGVPAEPITFQI